ncbi:MAG: hypothetical protein HY711_06685 [Candidatus Melainabacteria bacterium]|nr:hypothetical protein [Candidatus Melainabacteria bacterium]
MVLELAISNCDQQVVNILTQLLSICGQRLGELDSEVDGLAVYAKDIKQAKAQVCAELEYQTQMTEVTERLKRVNQQEVECYESAMQHLSQRAEFMEKFHHAAMLDDKASNLETAMTYCQNAADSLKQAEAYARQKLNDINLAWALAKAYSDAEAVQMLTTARLAADKEIATLSVQSCGVTATLEEMVDAQKRLTLSSEYQQEMSRLTNALNAYGEQQRSHYNQADCYLEEMGQAFSKLVEASSDSDRISVIEKARDTARLAETELVKARECVCLRVANLSSAIELASQSEDNQAVEWLAETLETAKHEVEVMEAQLANLQAVHDSVAETMSRLLTASPGGAANQ